MCHQWLLTEIYKCNIFTIIQWWDKSSEEKPHHILVLHSLLYLMVAFLGWPTLYCILISQSFCCASDDIGLGIMAPKDKPIHSLFDPVNHYNRRVIWRPRIFKMPYLADFSDCQCSLHCSQSSVAIAVMTKHELIKQNF